MNKDLKTTGGKIWFVVCLVIACGLIYCGLMVPVLGLE